MIPPKGDVPSGSSDDPAECLDYLEVLGEELEKRDVWRKVRSFAKRRARYFAEAGFDGLLSRIDELVADAVSDTAIGVCQWDPDKCALTTHLCGVIRGRTWKAYRHRHQLEMVPFDDGVDELELAHEPVESSEAPVVRAQVTERFIEALHDAAYENGDDEVVAMLAAYRRGLTKTADVARAMGVSVRKYENARKRLGRLIERLPADIRNEAIDVMRFGA